MIRASTFSWQSVYWTRALLYGGRAGAALGFLVGSSAFRWGVHGNGLQWTSLEPLTNWSCRGCGSCGWVCGSGLRPVLPPSVCASRGNVSPSQCVEFRGLLPLQNAPSLRLVVVDGRRETGAYPSAEDAFKGRRTVKQLPSPFSVSTSMVPLTSSTSWFTIESPSPVPSYSRFRPLDSW